MTSTKKRITATLTAAILTATLAVPAIAVETPAIRVSSYKGSTLEVGERSGLIIGPSDTEYAVTSSDPDTEQWSRYCPSGSLSPRQRGV